MYCACVLEPWSALQWFCLHHACNEMPLIIKHKFLCLKFKAHLLSFSDHPALSLTEDCWQERFPDSPGFCSFMFTKTEVDHSVFAAAPVRIPNIPPWPIRKPVIDLTLTVCPSDGICIRCTGFHFAFAQYLLSVCENLYRRIKNLWTSWLRYIHSG